MEDDVEGLKLCEVFVEHCVELLVLGEGSALLLQGEPQCREVESEFRVV